MGFARTPRAWRGEAGGIPRPLPLWRQKSQTHRQREGTKWARSTVLGDRGWLTFQGQAEFPWRSRAENIITRKGLGDDPVLLCY